MWRLLILGALIPARTVAAWGKTGHEIVGNLAWRLISPETQQLIVQILGDPEANKTDCSDCSVLGSIADWADQARYYYHWSAPLHYIDVRDDLLPGGCPVGAPSSNSISNLHGACFFNYTRDCVNNVCVAGAIVNYTNQLVYSTRSYSNFSNNHTIESLKFLTHFVGDIHQPLHCSRTSDRGGNDIHVKFDTSSSKGRRARFLRHGENLHAVWDDGLIEKSIQQNYNSSRVAMEQDLFRFICTHDRKNWLECANGGSQSCAIQWGQESLTYALKWAYRNIDGGEVLNGAVLGDEYFRTRLPIVRERLAVAGVRLATTLTLALSKVDLTFDACGKTN